jgi:hypothetical protein
LYSTVNTSEAALISWCGEVMNYQLPQTFIK